MPRATMQYHFEAVVRDWASGFNSAMRQNETDPFLMVLSDDGALDLIVFRSRETIESLRRSHRSWLFYDPFDAPEYMFVSWQNLDRVSLERAIGRSFSSDDFVSHESPRGIDFPTTWEVMY